MTASRQRPRGRSHTLAKLHDILLRHHQEQGPIICHLCGLPVEVDELEWDHLTPVSQAPERAESITNLAPAHADCNRERGDMTLPEWWAHKRTGSAGSRQWL